MWTSLALRSAARLHPPDLLAQEGIAERGESGALLVVLAVAVAAGGGLVEIRFTAHGLKFCRHLAGMSRMHAIVLARRRKEDRRIVTSRRRQVIGGISLQELPVFRLVRVAVFGDPARARKQLAV